MSEPLSERLRAGGTIHSDDDNDLMREAADLIDALVEALDKAIENVCEGWCSAIEDGPVYNEGGSDVCDCSGCTIKVRRDAILARAKGEPNHE